MNLAYLVLYHSLMIFRMNYTTITTINLVNSIFLLEHVVILNYFHFGTYLRRLFYVTGLQIYILSWSLGTYHPILISVQPFSAYRYLIHTLFMVN